MQNKQLAKRTSNTALARQSTLKKVGGSIMATSPPHLLRELRLAAGSRISVAKSDGRLIITGYTLSSDSIATSGAFKETYGGNGDIFLCSDLLRALNRAHTFIV